MALSKYGMMLNAAGEDTSKVWDLIKFDMEWVVPNWDQNGCDLWEEVQSDDFYWNRMAYVYSLNIAADFADVLGEADGASWRSLADSIKTTAEAHYNGAYIYESTNREQDGSVIHAVATFGEYLFPPNAPEVAAFGIEEGFQRSNEIVSGAHRIVIRTSKDRGKLRHRRFL